MEIQTSCRSLLSFWVCYLKGLMQTRSWSGSIFQTSIAVEKIFTFVQTQARQTKLLDRLIVIKPGVFVAYNSANP